MGIVDRFRQRETLPQKAPPPIEPWSERVARHNAWAMGDEHSRQAIVAAAFGGAVDVGYLLLVRGQGSDFAPRVVFYAAFVAVMAALSLAGGLVGGSNETRAQALLWSATTGYLLAGGLGLASIGLPLVLAGLFALVAARQRRLSAALVATVAALTASVFFVGIALT